MAKGQAVSGSQFFFTLDPAPLQDGGYPVLGKVTAGLDVVEAINGAGSATNEGTPTEAITIDSVAITEA